MPKSRTIIPINKRVLLNNFIEQNKLIFRMRELIPSELEMLLKNNNFVEEAEIFKNEQVDGSGFIVLLTEKEGIELIKEELGVAPQRIQKLKVFYKQIFEFRLQFCKDCDKDEIPFYSEF